MVVSSRYYAHPAPRPRAGGAAPAALRSGRREGLDYGRAKGGPVWDRPAGLLHLRPSGKSEPAAPSHTPPGQRANLKPRHSPGLLDTSAIIANYTVVSGMRQEFLFICRVKISSAC